MTLFKNKPVHEVVAPADVRSFSGASPRDFIFTEEGDPEELMDELIQSWIEETASNIYVRLGRQVDPDGPEAAGISGVIIRTVANIVAVAHQQRSTPIIRLGEFATQVLNASDALAKLDDELAPFLRFDPESEGEKPSSRIKVFWSSEEYEPR